MDPVKAGLSLYEAGGLALLLLGIIVVGASLMARFLMGMIRDLGARLREVENRCSSLQTTTIVEATTTMREVAAETRAQTAAIHQQTEVLRTRPCLVESGVQPRPHLPRP